MLIAVVFALLDKLFQDAKQVGKSNNSVAGVSPVHKNREKRTAKRRKLVVTPVTAAAKESELTIHPRSGSADFV